MESNPLFNQHILEKIFDFCKVSALLQCRLVCKLWEEESSRLLHRKAKVTLGITEDMINFSSSLESYSSPFSTFLIQFLSADQASLIYQILNKTKKCIKHINFQYQPQSLEETLTLDHEHGKETSSLLTLPHVESLHLFSTQFAPSEETLCMPTLFEKLNLPRLRSLTVIHLHDTKCTDTIIKLIKRSNFPIEKLKVPCTKLADIARETNLKELKELDLCELFHGSLATNQTLEILISSCPKLKKLSLELAHRVTTFYTNSLFLTLAETLENLKLTIQDKAILSRQIQKVNLRFPQMNKLKTLYLRYSNPGLNYFIDNLPQLNSLELDTPWQRKVKGDITPGNRSLDKIIYNNLSTLKLSETLTTFDVENVTIAFPKLAVLGCSFESNDAIAKVFENLPFLERLLVERRSNISDAGICGFSEYDIDRIAQEFRQDKAKNLDIAKWTSQRQYNFIGNLKSLKSLEFCQHGLTWISILFGVLSLTDLRTLTIQTTTIKYKTKVLTEDPSVVKVLKETLPMLSTLTLWIRRHDEKLNSEEGALLQSILSPTDVNILATICSVSY